MANNETTTKFKVDISELKKAMQEAKRSIAVTNSEFKAVSSSMDDWSKSSDGLSAKLKQLGSNLNSQKTILKSLEQQYELTVREMGEGSKAADDLKIKINNQQAVINQTEKEIGKYEDALSEVSEAEKTAAKTGKTIAEVLDDTADSASEAGDGFTVLKGAIATFAGNAITSLVGGLRDAATSLLSLADTTREYREDIGKLETAFASASVSADEAKETYKNFYAVLGEEDRSVEAVNHLAKFVDTEKDLATWTDICTGVWGTFGDSLPIEGLTEASNETMKTGQLTGVLVDALNWAGVSEDEFQASLDACTSEQERQALITDTLNGLYSDAANAYRETNASIIEANKANSDYTDTLATMGATLEPVTTAAKKGFNELLQELLKLVSDVDMEAFTAKIEEGFAVLKDDVLPAVKEGLGWILDNKDTIIAGLAGIAGGFVAFNVASMIMGVVNAFKAFKAANEGATVAQWLLNAAMNANPIMLIVTLVAAVVTAIVTFIATNDDARAKFTEIWQGIVDFFSNAVQGIVDFFTVTIPTVFQTAIDWIKENFDLLLTFLINPFAGLFKYFYENNTKFKEFVDNAIKYIKELPTKVWTWLLNTINKVTEWRNNMIAKAKDAASNFISNVVSFFSQLPSNIWTWLVNVVSKIVEWRNNLIAKGKEAAKGLLDAVVNGVKDLPDKMLSVGKDLVSGLWNGVSGAIGGLYENIKNAMSGLVDKAKNALGIHSPSKVFADEIGKWIPEGIAVGIDKNAKSALSSMKELAAETVGAANSELKGATTSVSGASSGVVNNFNQIINSPKQLSRLEIYRQSKNLLGLAGGGV